jgi:hypothetical protein
MKVNLDWEGWTRLASAEGAFSYPRASRMLHRIKDSGETSPVSRALSRKPVRAG